ncbi:hypothetical protein RHGRI_033527 [Rhododendron griersonianum]|uniref:NOG C-terminal domain-containing protein n=1 Tax=Rhododendron griersonianum TaxID=479676 RepID=A0AAV6HX47_9ERIC|nr:hypothetical protein RHGRI_033527 [Rhododendron griersonianum]
MPKPRDQKERPSCIPQAVLETEAEKEMEKKNKNLERDLEDETGGAGVYSADLKKHYILANDEWKGDEVGDDCDMDGHEPTAEKQEDLAKIRKRLIQQNRIKKSTVERRPIVPRKFDKDKEFTSERMGRQLSDLGLDPTLAINRARSRSRGRKWERSLDHMDMDVDQPNKKLRVRSMLWARSKSRPPSEVVPGEGFKDSAQKLKALKLSKKSVKKRNKDAWRGEADRVINTLKPKHLFSGKRSIGKTSRRWRLVLLDAPSPLIPFTVLITVEEVVLF